MNEPANKFAAQVAQVSGCEPRACMKCGKCSASCPVFDKLDYPPQCLIALLLAGRAAELRQTRSWDSCLACLACVERCPRGVKPAQLLAAVRTLALREQAGAGLSPDALPARVDAETPPQLLVSALCKYRK